MPGAGTFWTTDLTLRNSGDSAATATLRFLGHTGSSQVVRAIGLAAGETRTYRDVLHALFGLASDYGPILVTSAASALVVQGQTWTPSDGGTGTFGQSVPAVPLCQHE